MESASDYEVRFFKEIMENYPDIIIPENINDYDYFIMTREWAVYNRIFTSTISISIDGEGNGELGRTYAQSKAATLLFQQ